MNLSVGARVGPYEIVAPLGAGGMGQVYRAYDARLQRTVALKFLGRHLSADPEARARFQREAQLLASLDHPHIGAIHGVEDGPDGQAVLVLEFVDGQTLADRLKTDRVRV